VAGRTLPERYYRATSRRRRRLARVHNGFFMKLVTLGVERFGEQRQEVVAWTREAAAA